MWFLFVFFWAKLLYNLLNLIIKDQVILFAAIFAFAAYLLSLTVWLPQSLDIVPIAALFMAIGREIRVHNLLEFHWKYLVALLSIIIWLVCVQNGIYIELASRHYPQFIWSVMAAVGGSVVTFLCSISLAGNYKLHLFQLIGRHTLAIMCIHHLDLFWTIFQQVPDKSIVLIACRLLLDFSIFADYKKPKFQE